MLQAAPTERVARHAAQVGAAAADGDVAMGEVWPAIRYRLHMQRGYTYYTYFALLPSIAPAPRASSPSGSPSSPST